MAEIEEESQLTRKLKLKIPQRIGLTQGTLMFDYGFLTVYISHFKHLYLPHIGLVVPSIIMSEILSEFCPKSIKFIPKIVHPNFLGFNHAEDERKAYRDGCKVGADHCTIRGRLTGFEKTLRWTWTKRRPKNLQPSHSFLRSLNLL